MVVVRHQISKGNCLIIARTELLLFLDDFHLSVRCHFGVSLVLLYCILIGNKITRFTSLSNGSQVKVNSDLPAGAFFSICLVLYAFSVIVQNPFFNVHYSFEHCCKGTQV